MSTISDNSKPSNISIINEATQSAMSFNKPAKTINNGNGSRDAEDIVSENIEQTIQKAAQKDTIEEKESTRKLADIQEMLRKVSENLYSNSGIKH